MLFAASSFTLFARMTMPRLWMSKYGSVPDTASRSFFAVIVFMLGLRGFTSVGMFAGRSRMLTQMKYVVTLESDGDFTVRMVWIRNRSFMVGFLSRRSRRSVF